MKTDEIEKQIVLYNYHLRGSEQAVRQALYAITYHSTAFAGSTLNENQIFNLLENDKPSANRSFAHHLMTSDFYGALQFVLNAAKSERTITSEFIKQMAALVMKNTGRIVYTNVGDYHSGKGDYRKGTMRVGTLICPDQQLIPRMMVALCEETNRNIVKSTSIEDKFVAAFNLHYGLTTIHPFGEGNGRTACLLMNFVLARLKLPLSCLLKNDEERFNLVLEQVRKSEQIVPYIRFLKGQYSKFLAKGIRELSVNT